MNDFLKSISCSNISFKTYANDAIGSFTGDTNTTSFEYLMNKELDQINELLKLHKLSLNINKSKDIF